MSRQLADQATYSLSAPSEIYAHTPMMFVQQQQQQQMNTIDKNNPSNFSFDELSLKQIGELLAEVGTRNASWSALEMSDKQQQQMILPAEPNKISGHLLILFALLILINLIVIFGNILVIVAVYGSVKLRNVTNVFIVSLATADLLLGIFVLPYALVYEALEVWIFGRLWCRGWLVTDVWISTASILNLCAISIDRYVAVTRPVKYRSIMTTRRAKCIVATVWLLSFIISFPPLLGLSNDWGSAAPVVSVVTSTATTTTTDRHLPSALQFEPAAIFHDDSIPLSQLGGWLNQNTGRVRRNVLPGDSRQINSKQEEKEKTKFVHTSIRKNSGANNNNNGQSNSAQREVSLVLPDRVSLLSELFFGGGGSRHDQEASSDDKTSGFDGPIEFEEMARSDNQSDLAISSSLGSEHSLKSVITLIDESDQEQQSSIIVASQQGRASDAAAGRRKEPLFDGRPLVLPSSAERDSSQISQMFLAAKKELELVPASILTKPNNGLSKLQAGSSNRNVVLPSSSSSLGFSPTLEPSSESASMQPNAQPDGDSKEALRQTLSFQDNVLIRLAKPRLGVGIGRSSDHHPRESSSSALRLRRQKRSLVGLHNNNNKEPTPHEQTRRTFKFAEEARQAKYRQIVSASKQKRPQTLKILTGSRQNQNHCLPILCYGLGNNDSLATQLRSSIRGQPKHQYQHQKQQKQQKLALVRWPCILFNACCCGQSEMELSFDSPMDSFKGQTHSWNGQIDAKLTHSNQKSYNDLKQTKNNVHESVVLRKARLEKQLDAPASLAELANNHAGSGSMQHHKQQASLVSVSPSLSSLGNEPEEKLNAFMWPLADRKISGSLLKQAKEDKNNNRHESLLTGCQRQGGQLRGASQSRLFIEPLSFPTLTHRHSIGKSVAAKTDLASQRAPGWRSALNSNSTGQEALFRPDEAKVTMRGRPTITTSTPTTTASHLANDRIQMIWRSTRDASLTSGPDKATRSLGKREAWQQSRTNNLHDSLSLGNLRDERQANNLSNRFPILLKSSSAKRMANNDTKLKPEATSESGGEEIGGPDSESSWRGHQSQSQQQQQSQAQLSRGGKVGCTLFQDKTYVVYSALGSFYIPALVMLFFYSRIYLVASRAQKAMQRGYMTTKWPPVPMSGASGGGGSMSRLGSIRRNHFTGSSRQRGVAQGAGSAVALAANLLHGVTSGMATCQDSSTTKAPSAAVFAGPAATTETQVDEQKEWVIMSDSTRAGGACQQKNNVACESKSNVVADQRSSDASMDSGKRDNAMPISGHNTNDHNNSIETSSSIPCNSLRGRRAGLAATQQPHLDQQKQQQHQQQLCSDSPCQVERVTLRIHRKTVSSKSNSVTSNSNNITSVAADRNQTFGGSRFEAEKSCQKFAETRQNSSQVRHDGELKSYSLDNSPTGKNAVNLAHLGRQLAQSSCSMQNQAVRQKHESALMQLTAIEQRQASQLAATRRARFSSVDQSQAQLGITMTNAKLALGRQKTTEKVISIQLDGQSLTNQSRDSDNNGGGQLTDMSVKLDEPTLEECGARKSSSLPAGPILPIASSSTNRGLHESEIELSLAKNKTITNATERLVAHDKASSKNVFSISDENKSTTIMEAEILASNEDKSGERKHENKAAIRVQCQRCQQKQKRKRQHDEQQPQHQHKSEKHIRGKRRHGARQQHHHHQQQQQCQHQRLNNNLEHQLGTMERELANRKRSNSATDENDDRNGDSKSYVDPCHSRRQLDKQVASNGGQNPGDSANGQIGSEMHQRSVKHETTTTTRKSNKRTKLAGNSTKCKRCLVATNHRQGTTTMTTLTAMRNASKSNSELDEGKAKECSYVSQSMSSSSELNFNTDSNSGTSMKQLQPALSNKSISSHSIQIKITNHDDKTCLDLDDELDAPESLIVSHNNNAHNDCRDSDDDNELRRREKRAAAPSKRTDRSHSYGHGQIPSILVNWEPLSGHAESQLLLPAASKTMTDVRADSSLDLGGAQPVTSPPPLSLPQSSCQRSNSAAGSSGLSLMANLPNQVRKQSIILLSTLSSFRSSHSLRRLSNVASHPVDSLLASRNKHRNTRRRDSASNTTTATNNSFADVLSLDSSQRGDTRASVEGESSQRQQQQANKQPGGHLHSAEKTENKKKYKKLKEISKKRKRRLKKQQKRQQATLGSVSQQHPRRTLDDYLLAVAGIDSSSDDSAAFGYEEDPDSNDSSSFRYRTNSNLDRRQASGSPMSSSSSSISSSSSSAVDLSSMLRKESKSFALIPSITIATCSIVDEPRSCSLVATSPTPVREQQQQQAIVQQEETNLSGKQDVVVQIGSIETAPPAMFGADHEQANKDDQQQQANRSGSSNSLLHRKGARYESETSLMRAPSRFQLDKSDEQLDSNANIENCESGKFKTVSQIGIVPSKSGMIECDNSNARATTTVVQMRRNRGPKRTSRWHAKRLRAETKAAKTVAIIVGGFIFCWLPFFTAYLSRGIICSSTIECIPQSLMSLFTWLGYLNSAINPVIYGLFSADFRHAFKNIVCRCRFRLSARDDPRRLGASHHAAAARVAANSSAMRARAIAISGHSQAQQQQQANGGLPMNQSQSQQLESGSEMVSLLKNGVRRTML